MTIKSAATICPRCYGVAMIVDVDGDISLVCSHRGSAPQPPTERKPLPRRDRRQR